MIRKPKILWWILASPFALIYRIAVWIRNFMYDYKIIKSVEFDIPVISIGNISVGGTGKTPHSEFIIQMLIENHKVALLSRGYKRKTSGYREVQIDDNYIDVGDEPLQIKRKFPDVYVAVHEKRIKGIQKLMKDYPDLKVIILDDAFQHRKVKPGLSILLNDFNNPIFNDHLLPYGRLRESPLSAHRAHIIFVTKCPLDMKPIERRIMLKEMDVMPYQHLFFSGFEYLMPQKVFGDEKIDINDLKEYNILSVTGIAKSNVFQQKLKAISKSVKHLRYPDHHNFSASNIDRIKDLYNTIPKPKCIVTTEKDAIRLRNNPNIPEELKSEIWFIPVKVSLLCNDEQKLDFYNQILSYVKNNKRYSKLYKGTNIG